MQCNVIKSNAIQWLSHLSNPTLLLSSFVFLWGWGSCNQGWVDSGTVLAINVLILSRNVQPVNICAQ